MDYKPMDNLEAHDTVQLSKIGVIDANMKYPAHNCEVIVNGQPMQWKLAQKKHADLLAAGFKEGDTVTVQKWKKGPMSKGYNFVAPDKSNAYAQHTQQPQGNEPVVRSFEVNQADPPDLPPPPTSPHETAQPIPNLAGRGAAWNNAFMFFLSRNKGDLIVHDLDKFCAEVAIKAEKIAVHQSNFVNK